MIEINELLNNYATRANKLSYNPWDIRACMVYIGVGNFYRAYYTNPLFNQVRSSHKSWGSIVLGSTASARRMAEVI